LSLFDELPVQDVITKAQYAQFYPLNSLTGSSEPIEFKLVSSDTEMFDLNDTMLEIQGRILYTDNTVVDPTVDTSLETVDLFLHSMFNDLSIYLNDLKIEGGTFFYPYKSFITNLLQFDSSYKNNQLESAGGFLKIKPASDLFQYVGPICSDFFNQGRYLLSGTNLRVKLFRHRPEFCITSTTKPADKTGYQIVLSKAILHVRRCTINPSVLHGHELGLTKTPALYPIQHTQVTTFTIGKGMKSASLDNIFTGLSPKLLVFGMVKNEAMNGTLISNPFYFTNFGLTNVNLYVNNDVYSLADMDFDKKLCRHAYMQMYMSLDMLNQNDSNGLSYEDWIKDKTLFVYNLCPDLAFDGEHGQLKNRPSIRLDLQFMKELPDSINVMIYGIFDGLVSINKDRKVELDV